MLRRLTSVYKTPRHGSGDYPPVCRRRGFSIPGAVRVRFVVDQVSLRQVLLRPLRFSCVSIIPPVLHNHLHLDIFLEWQVGKAWKLSR